MYDISVNVHYLIPIKEKFVFYPLAGLGFIGVNPVHNGDDEDNRDNPFPYPGMQDYQDIKDGKVIRVLSTMQKSTIVAFFDNIGCVSSQELIRHIDYYKAVFETDAKKISEEVAKASIYAKLGILLGVMVGIVLM